MTKILLVDKNSILEALKDELANIVNNHMRLWIM